MNIPNSRSLIAIAVAAALLAGCASAPEKPAGSAEVRAKLIALQSDADLAAKAPLATKDAELAVNQAEIVQPDLELAAHRVYIADRKVDTARAQAETKAAEDQRTVLAEQGEKERLNARTREADRARADAMTAQAANAAQQIATTEARSEAEASRQQAAALQQQLADLQAKPTDRGLVLTLGDTLFATGKSDLRAGASANLDRLGDFLAEYPDRTATIEGFTDSMGSEDSNMALSERRADSVKRYLVRRGVESQRLSSFGRGENAPVADNESTAGRQQNRRVEVIISQAERVQGTSN